MNCAEWAFLAGCAGAIGGLGIANDVVWAIAIGWLGLFVILQAATNHDRQRGTRR